MKNKLVLIPDMHLQLKPSHHNAGKECLRWISNQDFNNKDTYSLQLGDLYDSSKAEAKVTDIAINHYHNDNKFKHNYVLAGNNNHEFDRLKNIHIISSIQSLENVTCIYEVQELKLGNLNILLIPWFYDNLLKDENDEFIKFKEYVNILPDKFKNKHYDLVLGHVNATDDFFSDFVDLSYLDVDRIVTGHIHTYQKKKNIESLGVSIPNKKGEDKKHSKLMIIDLNTAKVEYRDIPFFVKYKTINYLDEITPVETFTENSIDYKVQNIFIINECVDKKETIKHYTNLHKDDFCYCEINVKDLSKKDKDEKSINFNSKKLTTIEYLDLYVEENKVSKKVVSRLKEFLK